VKTETIILIAGIIGISLYSLFKKPYEIPRPYPVPQVVRVPTTVITPPARTTTTYNIKMEAPKTPELPKEHVTKTVKPEVKPEVKPKDKLAKEGGGFISPLGIEAVKRGVAMF